MKKMFFSKMRHFCIATMRANREKVIFRFSALKLAKKKMFSIISKNFCYTMLLFS